MIGIITEQKYTNLELINLKKQGCIVNYTLIPPFYSNYNTELEKANNTLISKASGIIFRITTFYAGTKDAIERALYFKKPIRIYYDNKIYDLKTIEDWRNSTGYKSQYDSSTCENYKHPLLQIYEAQRAEYYEKLKQLKAKEYYEEASAGIQDTLEDVTKLVQTFAYEYDIDVDYNDTASICLAYKSIKYYLDNNIEYTNPVNSTEDNWCFSLDDEESFGNQTYLEDALYTDGIYADITGKVARHK